MANYHDQLLSIIDLYRSAGQTWPATSHQIGEWAITHGHWQLGRGIAVTRCAEDIARAMREVYVTDRKGRRVRRYHAARTRRGNQQLTLWADIDSAQRGHMELAFAQRRQQIVGDCHQLKMDVDSYNDGHADDKPIQMVFDFTNDLAELEQLDIAV